MTGHLGARGQCPSCGGVMVASSASHPSTCASCHTTVSRVRGITLVQPRASR